MGIIAERWVTAERVQLKVQRATGLRRLTGLIARRPPAAATAMLFTRCHSVHGWGIREPLDVLFLSGGLCVLSVGVLRRWRVLTCRGARHTLELKCGEARRLGIANGTQFKKISQQGGKSKRLKPLTRYEHNFSDFTASLPRADRRGR